MFRVYEDVVIATVATLVVDHTIPLKNKKLAFSARFMASSP